MANEFKHKTVGTQLTQSEYEAIGGHVLDSQAAGDIIYASSTTQLSRLGIGTAGKLLAVNSGATAPEYVAAVTGVTSVLNTALVVGRDADNDIDFATDNNIIFRAGGADQIKLIDGALLPVTDDDVDLGSSSLQFKNGYFDGTVEADAITVGGTAVVTAGAVTSITSLLATDIKIGEDDETKIDFETADEIHFYANNVEQVYLGDNIFGPQSDSDVDLGSNSVRWKDAYIDTVTTTGDVTVGGDLTITGDDLVMGTNTSGHLLIADGTNYNPTAVGDLSEISSVAADDVLLAVDTSGGGLKKITRSTLVSGLATSSGIANVADDSTPQLGGDLDMNGQDIVTTSNATIDLAPNGTGTVVIRGNTNPGTIVLNCESNSHGQTIKAQAHSEGVTNTLTLPAGGNGELVSTVSTQTLTNKRLTSPKINEDVAVTSTATELNVLDGITAVVGELNALDLGSTAVGTAIASKAVVLDANKDYTGLRNFTITGELDAATLDISGDADIDGTLETDALSINGTAVTSTAAELNLLDGVSGLVQADFTKLAAVDATAAELNIMDGDTNATSTTVADADRVVLNDNGTMVQVAVTDLAAYFDDEITAMPNLVTTGTLNSGAISSGFGNIDIGSSTFDTTGAVSTGNLSPAGDVAIADAKLIKLGGSRMATAEPATNQTGYGTVVGFDSAGSVSLGDAVYINSSGKVAQANAANGSTTDPAIGIATNSAASEDDDCYVLIHGIWRNDSETIDEGKPVYVGESAGAITKTRPSDSGDLIQVLGIGVGDGTFLVMPSLDVIEHA